MTCVSMFRASSASSTHVSKKRGIYFFYQWFSAWKRWDTPKIWCFNAGIFYEFPRDTSDQFLWEPPRDPLPFVDPSVDQSVDHFEIKLPNMMMSSLEDVLPYVEPVLGWWHILTYHNLARLQPHFSLKSEPSKIKKACDSMCDLVRNGWLIHFPSCRQSWFARKSPI